MKTSRAFIFLLLISNISYADSIFIGVYTEHISHGSGLNENNNLIGLKLNDFVAATFENSQYNRSWFLGYDFQTKNYYFYNDFFIKGNLYLGVLRGYDLDFNLLGFTPAGTITGEIGYDRFSVEAMLMPIDGGVLSLILNYNF